MKPLLKWAGGKRWLLPILKELWQPYQSLPLVEPFTGGMAVALGLNPHSAILNDINIHLINFYKQVKKGLIIPYQFKNKEKFYYEMRDRFNELIIRKQSHTKEAACYFYYLMRTGFNGLCRFNRKGEFNVPFGSHKNILYREHFFEYKDVLKPWTLMHKDFENLKLKGQEFIYADPPYDVEFTQYHANGFDWEDQIRLASWLVKHKGPVMVSNQATKRVVELYQDLKFQVHILDAPRTISCTGNRDTAKEILAIKI